MPGAYAHITAVNVARERMGEDASFPNEGKAIAAAWLKYCELGAVSPDYPYLNIADGRRSGQWADAMHWDRTGDRILAGVRTLARMPQTLSRERSLAWLLGFAAHVVMDATVHPVVGLKVGQPYEEHKMDHRTCEMHQDTYIFESRLNLGIHYANHLTSGICSCSDPDDEDRIDPDVFYLWNEMFKEADMRLYVENAPSIHAWHDCFEDIVGHVADSRLVALARHIAPGMLDGNVYPLFEDVEAQYLTNLEVPGGGRMDYDATFDKGVGNVVRAWAVVASDVLTGTALAGGFLRNWNLDTGEDEAGTLTFWS